MHLFFQLFLPFFFPFKNINQKLSTKKMFNGKLIVQAQASKSKDTVFIKSYISYSWLSGKNQQKLNFSQAE